MRTLEVEPPKEGSMDIEQKALDDLNAEEVHEHVGEEVEEDE